MSRCSDDMNTQQSHNKWQRGAEEGFAGCILREKFTRPLSCSVLPSGDLFCSGKPSGDLFCSVLPSGKSVLFCSVLPSKNLFCSFLTSQVGICSVLFWQAKWGCSATFDCNRLCTCCNRHNAQMLSILLCRAFKISYRRNASSGFSHLLAPANKGRVPKKKYVFLLVFCQTGGRGGSPRVVKKPYCFFEEKKFFFREHVKSF